MFFFCYIIWLYIYIWLQRVDLSSSHTQLVETCELADLLGVGHQTLQPVLASASPTELIPWRQQNGVKCINE